MHSTRLHFPTFFAVRRDYLLESWQTEIKQKRYAPLTNLVHKKHLSYIVPFFHISGLGMAAQGTLENTLMILALPSAYILNNFM